MKTGTNFLDILYVIVDTDDELPAYVADTFEEAREWLGISKRWMTKMLRENIVYDHYYVVIVDDT